MNFTPSQNLFSVLGKSKEYVRELTFTEWDDDYLENTGLTFGEFSELLANEVLLRNVDRARNNIYKNLEDWFSLNLSAQAWAFYNSAADIEVWDRNSLVDTILFNRTLDNDSLDHIKTLLSVRDYSEYLDELQGDENLQLTFDDFLENFIDELTTYFCTDSFSAFRDSALIVIDSFFNEVLREIN